MARRNGLNKRLPVSDMQRHRRLHKRRLVRRKAEVVIEVRRLKQQMTEPVKAIYLPVMVIFCANRLVPTTPHGFRSVFRFRSAPNQCLVCSDASLPRMQVTHILDRRGYFHRLIPLTKRRAFLSWFARVWDFTKLDCALDTMEPRKVGELLAQAKNWKNNSGRNMRRFLAKQNFESVFDEAMFKQAWEATSVPLPESEWSRVFELHS